MATDQLDYNVAVAVRKLNRRHCSRQSSQHLLSLCLSTYIVVQFSSPSLFFKMSVKRPEEVFAAFGPPTGMANQFEVHRETFKSRPVRIRYRDDRFLLPPFSYGPTYCADFVARPILTEDHNYFWSQNPPSSCASSSSSSSSVAAERAGGTWNQQVQLQKRNCLAVRNDDYFQNDLPGLTKKNAQQSLSSTEVTAYQNSAKRFYDGYLAQTTPNRLLGSDHCPRSSQESSDRWVNVKDLLKNESNQTVVSDHENHVLHNTTYLDLENPILNNVSLAQSAFVPSSSESHNTNFDDVSRSLQNNSAVTSCGTVGDEAAGSLSPSLNVDDYDFDRYCLTEQVKADVTQSVLELNSTYEDSVFYSDLDYPSTSSGSSFSGNHSYLSSPSTGSNSNGFYQRDSKTHTRGYGKLYPAVDELYSSSMGLAKSYTSEPEGPVTIKKERRVDQVSDKRSNSVRGNRGRRSKDEFLAAKFNLPANAATISSMSLSEMQRMSTSLNDEQRAVMKKIRRRGKNKLAARMCRQRKTTIVMPPLNRKR